MDSLSPLWAACLGIPPSTAVPHSPRRDPPAGWLPYSSASKLNSAAACCSAEAWKWRRRPGVHSPSPWPPSHCGPAPSPEFAPPPASLPQPALSAVSPGVPKASGPPPALLPLSRRHQRRRHHHQHRATLGPSVWLKCLLASSTPLLAVSSAGVRRWVINLTLIPSAMGLLQNGIPNGSSRFVPQEKMPPTARSRLCSSMQS